MKGIQMASADLDQTDVDAVLAVVRSGRLTMGSQTEEFERVTAEYCGSRYAVAVSSGTAGLHLLTIAAGVTAGDEVITSPFSFVASTNCILYEGAQPKFVDIEPDTYCMDPQLIEAAIGPKTKAIVGVDVFGHPADWDRIIEIARRHDLRVIVDSCESLGSEYKGRKTGSMGDGGVFAYFPNKQITTGEGGMIVTNDKDVYTVCRSLRNQGRDESGPWLEHVRLGYNYRMDELSAALGVRQMQRIEEFITKRRTVAELYDSVLGADPRLRTPKVQPHVRMSYFVYVVELQGEIRRDAVMRKMLERGIPTRGYFSPIHLQPYLLNRPGLARASCPVTERVSQRTIALPFHNNLSENEVKTVARILRESLDELSA